MKKIIFLAMIIAMFLVMGCSKSNSGLPKAPSGNNCSENVAYLQDGVNRYKEAFGAYPQDVDELLNKIGEKGPFVEKVPKCPTGNRYIIENGMVREAPPQ